MSLNEYALKDLLHGIVEWIPFTHEEMKNEFHKLVDNLDGSVTAALEAEAVQTPVATPAPATTDSPAPSVSVPTAQENADAVANALAPSLNAIATALGNLAPATTEAPTGVPAS